MNAFLVPRRATQRIRYEIERRTESSTRRWARETLLSQLFEHL